MRLWWHFPLFVIVNLISAPCNSNYRGKLSFAANCTDIVSEYFKPSLCGHWTKFDIRNDLGKLDLIFTRTHKCIAHCSAILLNMVSANLSRSKVNYMPFGQKSCRTTCAKHQPDDKTDHRSVRHEDKTLDLNRFVILVIFTVFYALFWMRVSIMSSLVLFR